MKKTIALLLILITGQSHAQDTIKRSEISRNDAYVVNYTLSDISLNAQGDNVINGVIEYADPNESKYPGAGELISEEFSVYVNAEEPLTVSIQEFIWVEAQFKNEIVQVPTQLKGSHRQTDSKPSPVVRLKISTPSNIVLLEEVLSVDHRIRN